MLGKTLLGRPYIEGSEKVSTIRIPYERLDGIGFKHVATFMNTRVRAEVDDTVFYRRLGFSDWRMLKEGEEIPDYGYPCDELEFRYPDTDIVFYRVTVNRKGME